MNGSTVFQVLYATYHDALVATVAQQANAILAAATPWVQAAIGLAVIIYGKNLMFGEARGGATVTRMVRTIIVCALMTPANFNQYVTQQATQTIPNAIGSAVTGQPTAQGAQAFDGLNNAVQNVSAQIQAQLIGIWYIGDRVAVWIAAGTARILIAVSFLIWICAQAALTLVVPLGGFVIPFALFDTTREFAMRWFGKIIALFLVLAVTLMVANIVVKQDAQYMQQYGKTVQASGASQTFSMNAGDINFTGSEIGALGGPGVAPQAVQANTINTTASIDMLWNISLTFFVGAFLMAIMVGIALYIGGSSGFSAAPAITAVTILGSRAASAVGRTAGAASKKAFG